MGMVELGAPDSNPCLIFLSSVVTWKARTSDGFSQDGANSHSKHNAKCHSSEDACGGVGTASEEWGAGEAQGEGDEQGVAESLLISFDHGVVAVLH